MSTPAVTVVIPVYRNRETVRELARRLRIALGDMGRGGGIVFVNDACPDGSLEELKALAREYPGILVLDLDRNRGQHLAVIAGLACVRSPLAAVMDADLQDPPEEIPRLIGELERSRSGVVFGGRHGHYEPAGRMFTSRLFKLALSAATGLPSDMGMFFVMNSEARERILSLHSQRPFVTALIGCAGLSVSSVPIQRSTRPSGTSAYTGGMRFRAGLNALECVGRLGLGLDSGQPPVGEAAVRAIRARYGALLAGS